MMISVGAETLSIGAIFPFMALVIDPTGISNSGHFPAKMILAGQNIFGHHFVSVLALGLFLTFLFKNFLLYFLVVFENKVIFRNMTYSETKLFTRYLEAPLLYHLSANTSNLIRNVTLEIGTLFNSFLRSTFSIMVDFMMVIAILALLILVSPGITLGTFIVLGLTSYFFNHIFGSWFSQYGLVRQQAAAKLIQWINQGLGGIKEIKVLKCEGYFAQQYMKSAKQHREAEAKFNSLSNVPKLFFEVLAVTAMLTLIVILTWSHSSRQNIIPLIAMFSMAGMRLAPAFNRIMGQMGILKYYQPALDLVSRELRHLDSIEKIIIPHNPSTSSLQNGLHLDFVSFRYPNQERDALKKITLDISTHEAIGVIGESGAGKTTLINVILGLIQPTRGAAYIDGVPLDETIKKGGRFIGYVPQEIFLSDDTIRNNVAYGLHADEIQEEKVWRALQLAHLDIFVKSLSEGLDTVVGERGARISGGQKQRIGIARALYSEPKLLILDEPTSALDSETEKEIAAAIDTIAADKMVIMITHRHELLEHCDRIYRMIDGYLEEIQIDLLRKVQLASGHGHASPLPRVS